MEKNNIIYLKLLAVAFFWGGTFIATRLAAQEVLPFLGALLRFLFAVIALLFLLKIKKETFFPIKKETFWWNVGLAFSGIIVYNYFFFSALKILPASRASLLVSLNPIIVLFAGAFFYKDKLTLMKILGAICSLLGAIIVIARGDLSQLTSNIGTGELFALGCPFSWAIYTLINRKLVNMQSALMTTTYASAFAVVGLLPIVFFEGINITNLSSQAWLSLAYLGVFGTVLGFIWYSEGIATIGVAQTAIFNNLVPVFGVLLSVVFLGEKINMSVILGGLLVILGVSLINFGHLLAKK